MRSSSSLDSNLWQLFLQGLNKVDPSSLVVKEVIANVFPDIKKAQLPRIRTENTNLICENKIVSLESSPMVLKLFQVFLAHPDWRMDRDTMMKKVYELDDVDHMSSRRFASCRHSAVKLVSRARKIVAKEMHSVAGMKLSWLVYDNISETWSLVKRKVDAAD